MTTDYSVIDRFSSTTVRACCFLEANADEVPLDVFLIASLLSLTSLGMEE
jgi:hypothetical protein